jgi:O-antigen/teichoic acid export membrane protein
VVLNLSRGLCTDPLTVRFSGTAHGPWRDATRQAAGSALVVGIAAGLLCLAAGVLLGGAAGRAFVALGIVLPALLLQDSWRYAFFAAGRGASATLNDLVWGVMLVPALLLASHRAGVGGFVLGWGAAAAVAALTGCLQLRLLPAGPRAVLGWLRNQLDLGLRYMLENTMVSGAAQLRLYGLGAIAGLAAVGSIRGAQLLLGPFMALLMGVSLVSVPEAARVLSRSRHRLLPFCLVLGGGQAVAGALWGAAILLLVSEAVGRRLLGDVWPSAVALLVPTTLVVMAGSFSDGAMAGLRALGAARRSLFSQTNAACAYLALGLGGAALGGAMGSAWGVALATAFSAAVAWYQLRSELHHHRPHGPSRPRRRPEKASQP